MHEILILYYSQRSPVRSLTDRIALSAKKPGPP